MQKSTINTFSECGHHSCTVYYGICFRNENQGTEFSFVWYKKFQERYVRQFFFLLSIFITTIPHKIFETNSSFHVKQHTMGNVKFLLLISFLPVLKKKIILGERLRTTKIFLIIPNFLSS